MSESLRLITPPAAEPVSVGDLKQLMRISLTDTSRDKTLLGFLVAAREDCENVTRSKLVTQTWLLKMDSFPGVSIRYDRNGFPEIRLPFAPFQSVDWFKYVDTAGAVQTLLRDTSYGTNPAEPFYGYQLEPGGGSIPARLLPPWARPWAPQILVPANTMVQFRCGYGGPITASMTQGSALLSAANFTFNPDDAPALTGETGTKICIPGAGTSGAALNTFVASVDGSGNATLADPAMEAVVKAAAWLGDPIPEPLKMSILFHAQFLALQNSADDQAIPRIVKSLRDPYANFIS